MFRINYKYVPVIFLLFVFIAIPVSFADSYGGAIKTTPVERAVFGYFRAVGSVPDYEFWIKTGDNYPYIADDQKANYLYQETLRLGQGYSHYNPNENLLELSMEVVVIYKPATETEKAHISFEFFEGDESYIPSFDYPYGRDAISLVVNQLAFFADMELEEAQEKAISEKVPMQNDYFEATLTIHVRPSDQSSKRPIDDEETRKWLMIGEVAYIKCEAQGQALWDYSAPWYAEILHEKNMPDEEKYPHPYDLFKD